MEAMHAKVLFLIMVVLVTHETIKVLDEDIMLVVTLCYQQKIRCLITAL